MIAQEFECVPIRFDPKPNFGFQWCKVVQGVFLRKFTGQLGKLIANELAKKDSLGFRPTHLIVINHSQYEVGVFSRLSEEGKATPDLKKEYAPGLTPLRPDSTHITKQVLLSLILHHNTPFCVRGSFRVRREGKRQKYSSPIYSPSELRRVSTSMWEALPSRTTVMTRNDFVKTAHRLDRYYRSGMWWSDQLAMALNALWEALCTPFPVQAFLSLTSVLESILTAHEKNITQKLARRTALLLTQDGQERDKIEVRVKKLSRIRGKLTHGNSHLRKGEINTETLAVGAKYAIVPMSK